MTPERLEEIEQFATRFGCANCWTGTVGAACVYIRELLNERRELLQTLGGEHGSVGAVAVSGDRAAGSGL